MREKQKKKFDQMHEVRAHGGQRKKRKKKKEKEKVCIQTLSLMATINYEAAQPTLWSETAAVKSTLKREQVCLWCPCVWQNWQKSFGCSACRASSTSCGNSGIVPVECQPCAFA